MLTISNFLKQILKGAAVQLGVQVIVENTWPKAKELGNKILGKLNEQKKTEELENLVEETKKREQATKKSGKDAPKDD